MGFPIQHDLAVEQGADFTETYTWHQGVPAGARDRGDYSPDVTYLRNDLTLFANVLYVAGARVKGENPDVSSSWTALEVVDLSGYTARMMAREHKTGDPVLTLTNVLDANGSGITLGGAAGTIQLALTNDTTDLLPDAYLAFDLELVSAGDLVTPFMKGLVVVGPQVTHD